MILVFLLKVFRSALLAYELLFSRAKKVTKKALSVRTRQRDYAGTLVEKPLLRLQPELLLVF